MDLTKLAIKAIDLNDSEVQIEGYAVVYGSPNEVDTVGDWFAADTEYGLDWIKERPALWHHGVDGQGPTLIGTIREITKDTTGVFVRAVLNKSNQFWAAIKSLIEQGKLYWSSGTLPQLAKRDGSKITHWPIIEASLTPTPADWRGYTVARTVTPEQAAMAYKSSNLAFPAALTEGGEQENVDVQEPGAEIPAPETPAELPADQPASVETETVPESIPNPNLKSNEVIMPNENAPGEVDANPVIPADQNPNHPPSRVQVTRATPYSHLKAIDIAFLATVARAVGWDDMVSEQFIRETEDKISHDPELKQYAKSNELLATSIATTGGANWATQAWVNDVWDRARMACRVLQLFDEFPMDLPTMIWPSWLADGTAYHAVQIADAAQLVDTDSNRVPLGKQTVSKVTFDAEQIGIRRAWSKKMQAQFGSFVTSMRSGVEKELYRAIDSVLVNGDTVLTTNNNLNLYDGTPGTSALYTTQDGILKWGIKTNTGQIVDVAAALDITKLRLVTAKLNDSVTLVPQDCALICGRTVYDEIKGFAEFQTVDKAGPNAVILTGQVGAVDGIPIIPTDTLGKAAATGLVSATPGNNTKARFAVVHRPSWKVGRWGGVEVELKEEYGGAILFFGMYLAFMSHPATDHSAVGYDIT